MKARDLPGFRHWDRICSTWKACLRWKTRGFPERHELGLSLPVHERNKAALLLSLSKQSTNEYRLNRQTCPGIQSVPHADLNIRSTLTPNMSGGDTVFGVFNHTLTLLEPQSRFGDKPVQFRVVCLQNGTAALKGLGSVHTKNRTYIYQGYTAAGQGINDR